MSPVESVLDPILGSTTKDKCANNCPPRESSDPSVSSACRVFFYRAVCDEPNLICEKNKNCRVHYSKSLFQALVVCEIKAKNVFACIVAIKSAKRLI